QSVAWRDRPRLLLSHEGGHRCRAHVCRARRRPSGRQSRLMARFLIDEQLPPALGRFLKAAGHEAVHIYSIGLGGASDESVYREALARKAILITKDVDFVI